jgi:hypothetical protein
MQSIKVTVTTSPTLLIAADNKNRTTYIHNPSGTKIYVGDASVSTTTGLHIENGMTQEILVPLGETLFGIVASSTADTIVLTPNLD